MKTLPLTLHVTAKDLREGIRGDAAHCAVGRALARAIRRVMKVEPADIVVIASLTATTETLGASTEELAPEYVAWYSHWWVSSSALQRYIADFDRGVALKPAKFMVQPGPDYCADCGDD